MSQAGAQNAKRIDRIFWYCAFGCLAMSLLGAFLLKLAFFLDPANTGIARPYAVGISSCLILTLPAFLITIKWSDAGAIGIWLVTSAVAALATLAGAFTLATPLLAILIFAASISTAVYLKDRNSAPSPKTEACTIDMTE
jgi:hypothetical protein